MKPPILIFVLYDGVSNSVFSGQVLQPLLERIKNNPDLSILLISFEKQLSSAQQIIKQIPPTKNLTMVVLKKYPFLGANSMLPAVGKLKKILQAQPQHNLIARGPLAGWLCMRARNKKNSASLVVQARGLLAEEYRYMTEEEKNPLKRWWRWWQGQQFQKIERIVYGNKNKNITIESVSPALKTYLVKTFGANPRHISIATQDLPRTYKPSQVALWKKEVRKHLHITNNTQVYCYNGSIKPWQCPEEVVSFFAQEYKKNKNRFLLVLTQNKQAFEQLLHNAPIPSHTYRVLTVTHNKVYQYLAGCDTGIIFRKRSIVNWVARPTKILEYRAVGLSIVHNNTIAWLVDKPTADTR